ncbi:hypothetical protein PCASD_16631 [Puccinia coronata f. sp. avenae]|uniref:Uncharacterized protein n=1 Tax=Puccinia coronata f. sp. avenae TaxID=200324 RepID=A0A2N5T3N5_9BASI|nr:hypothetical protein PCASD_16631 [Puccinia coronata f. sp. avenae]
MVYPRRPFSSSAYGGFNPPMPTLWQKTASKLLGATMWFFMFYRIREDGQQVYLVGIFFHLPEHHHLEGTLGTMGPTGTNSFKIMILKTSIETTEQPQSFVSTLTQRVSDLIVTPSSKVSMLAPQLYATGSDNSQFLRFSPLIRFGECDINQRPRKSFECAKSKDTCGIT